MLYEVQGNNENKLYRIVLTSNFTIKKVITDYIFDSKDKAREYIKNELENK